MTLEQGTQLGPYEIIAPLGAGGMGVVYRARDTKLGREVAIKVLPEAFTQDAGRLARFEREAKLLAQLQHPGIASIYGLEEAAGKLALVMELVEGPTLAERLRSGALELEESLTIARQIAKALEEAHEKGIVHRDLKPGNVIAPVDGKIKVLDFGLAKAMDPLSDAPDAGALVTQSPTLTAGATAQGVILGTAAYMAPEQAKGTAVDKRADIWAFGVVLYEMLTGAKLFDAPTVPETLAQVLTKKPDLEALPASTPAAVRRLLRRCLERNPKDRLHDVADARLVLDDLRGVDAAAAEEARGAAPGARRSPWRLAAASLVAGAVGTLGVVALLDRGPAAIPMTPLRATLRLPASLGTIFMDRPIALSPDGSRLAIAMSDKRTEEGSLHLRSLNDLRLRPLAGIDDTTYPFWSPDGGAIGFFAAGKLRRIDLASGAVRTLCEAPQGRGAAWSPRGTIVFAPGATGPLSQVSAEGGTPTELTRLVREGEDQRNPHYLPDGRSVLFWAKGRGSPGEKAVYVFDPDRGEAKKILDSPTEALYVEPGYLAFLADGTLMLQPFDARRLERSGAPQPIALEVRYNFDRGWIAADLTSTGRLVYQESGRAAPLQLAWVDAAGNETPAWAGTLGDIWESGRVSPDGRRAAVVWRDGNYRVWFELLDFEAGTRARIGRPGLDFRFPVWSPDGERLAGTAQVDGQFQLAWIPPLPDETVRPLTSGSGMAYQMGGFTPDGRAALFSQWSDRDKLGDLFVVDLEGDAPAGGAPASGTPPRPVFVGPGQEHFPSLSPDGRWAAYQSDASGRDEIWVIDFPAGGGRRQVTTGMALREWGWLSEDEIWWRDTGNHIAATKIRPRSSEVEVIASRRLLGGRVLTETEAILDYSPVRQRFLLGRSSEPEKVPDLVVVSDWRAALRAGGTKP